MIFESKMKHEAVVYGSVPSKVWVDIPSYNGKYQINKDGQVRAYYRYGAHNIDPHYKLLSVKGGSVVLYDEMHNRTKLCVDYLLELCFGVQHIDSLPNEERKPIKGYEGYYKVSNKGRIISERRFLTRKNGVKQFCKEQIVQAKTIINSGYRIVNLIKDKKPRKFLVHRVVAEHFVDNPNNLPFVNHKDENKLNNISSNLEWCDRSYNGLYGTCQERRIATRLRNNNGDYGYKRKVNK